MKNNRNTDDWMIGISKDNLQRMIDWIASSDQKIGIIMIVLGTATAYLSNKVGEIIKIFAGAKLGFWEFIVAFSITIYVFLIIKSGYFIFRALYPDIKTRSNSLFFFGSIASQNKEDFKRQIKSLTKEQVIDNLNDQTHIISELALFKFEKVKRAMESLFLAAIFWLILLVLIPLLSR